MNSRIILLRKLNFATLGIALYYALLHNKSTISFIDASNYCLKILSFISQKTKLVKLNPIGHYQHNCYGKAIDYIDKVYNSKMNNSYFLKKVSEEFTNINYHFVFKKELIDELSNAFYVYDIAKEQSLDNVKVSIIDYRFFQYNSFLDVTSSLEQFKPPFLIQLPEIFNYNFLILRSKIKLILIYLYIVFIIIGNRFRNTTIKTYKIAVLIKNIRHQFKANGKYFDFIIDRKSIYPEDVLFIEMEAVAASFKNQVSDYSFTGDLSFKNLKNYGKRIVLVKQLSKYFKMIAYALLSQKSLFFTKGVTSIFLNSLRWENIMVNYSFEHFITFNDESSSHIARNIILNNHHIETWYYAHSAAMGYVSEIPNSQIDKRHILWTYLYYDHYVAWNTAMVNFILKHPVNFKNTHVVGCLWSQFIVQNRTLDKQKEIVVFDTSYIDNIKEGIQFYLDIVEYGLKNKNVKITFKPKKKITDYIPGKYFYGTSDYHKIQDIYNQIKDIPNISIDEFDGDSYFLISNADLVITHAISSPSIEAISAQIPALYYDPANKYANTIYSTLPALVVCNKEELWKQIDNLINIRPEDYRQFIHMHYKGVVDDYFDGHGIDRFRNLLLD
ncbi:MAG: polysaccharide biosynthesis PFTS motif protein [bacterium]|nr:polysaccharide biosynthesis PFTS motif protein [bacterium]